MHWRLFCFSISTDSNTAAGGRRDNVFSLKIRAALHLLALQPHHEKNSSPSLLLLHPHTDIHSAYLAALRESNCWFMFHHEDSLFTPLSLKALSWRNKMLSDLQGTAPENSATLLSLTQVPALCCDSLCFPSGLGRAATANQKLSEFVKGHFFFFHFNHWSSFGARRS